MKGPERGRRIRRGLLLIYLVLLVASNLARQRLTWTPDPDSQVSSLRPVRGDHVVEGSPVKMAWRVWPATDADGPVILLIHGSPGEGSAMSLIAESLPARTRRVAPDLPGFGNSTRDIPDYSVRAHAAYLAQWLDEQHIPGAHLVVHSMGGGVAIELAHQRPELVKSISLLSAIGVVEHELLGNQTLNHGIHGVQLVGLELLAWGVPHFGLLDKGGLNVPYARNFYDTDQGALRGELLAYQGPMLIAHGKTDFLVPVEAARENARIVPQAALVEMQTDHFFPFRPDQAASVAELVGRFIEDVEAGRAPIRATASQPRIAAAAEPYAPRSDAPARGVALLTLCGLLALATLVSEDLTCITAGLFVASGRLGILAASIACFVGLLGGDLLLFLAGRWLGRSALRRAPLRWWVSEAAVDRASAWYRRNGVSVIFTSRFMPGMRLPMYVAAGVLRTSFPKFAGYFALACAVWTPLLVGLSALLGAQVSALLGAGKLWAMAGLAIGLLLVLRALVPLATHRGRRLALGAWRRRLHWEFWPPYAFYPPVVAYIAWLAIKARSLTVFTAVNPGMPAGGFIGESKWDIYQRLGPVPELPDTLLLRASEAPAARVAAAREWIEARQRWPVVLKPDAGQRGFGVLIARDHASVERYVQQARTDTLLQEHCAGVEYGLFYVRHPSEPRGRIFSMTWKKPLDVVGDGKRTLEELILDDDRAVCLAPTHLAKHADRLMTVPAEGEQVRLVEIGTHSRGCVFLDGSDKRTPALEAAVDRLSRRFRGGFFFGRYDVRAESVEALAAGRFKILELNGATSEAVHIYDPKNGVLYAWRTLFEQWRLCFEIAAANAAAGAPVTGVRALIAETLAYRRATRGVSRS